MILITSAAYVDQDLSSEFGLIPPSFLPVGNRRLYEYQIELFSGDGDDIYLSLPASFKLNESDKERISQLGAEILFVPDNASLGESVLYSWNATGKSYDKLKVIHGDTYFFDFDCPEVDCLSVSANNASYSRASVEFDENNSLKALHQCWVNDSRYVLSGFFCFISPLLFMKCIVESKNNFVQAVQNYSLVRKVNCHFLEKWLDFGHQNIFFSSRTAMTTQRVFNDLVISKRCVKKKSRDDVKIKSESNWFEKLPCSLKGYTPALLQSYRNNDDSASYVIEYLYLSPLSDLFVFGDISIDGWEKIFLSAKEVLDELFYFRYEVDEAVDLISINDLYLKKTLSRLEDYEPQCSPTVEMLAEMAYYSSFLISEARDDIVSIVHGDFCFSNILYDSRSQLIKMIDPRGMNVDRKMCLLGDRRYDLAKLFHSAVGWYDLIIAGRYRLEEGVITFHDAERLDLIEETFYEVFLTDDVWVSKQELLAINVHLFISMLPLHNDRPDRQIAMIANAKRLFNKLDHRCFYDCNTNGRSVFAF